MVLGGGPEQKPTPKGFGVGSQAGSLTGSWQPGGSLAGSWPAAWQAAGRRLAGWQHGCLEVSEKLPIGNQSLKKREEQIGTREDESQWIVAQRPLSHLQYLDSTGSSVQDFPNP